MTTRFPLLLTNRTRALLVPLCMVGWLACTDDGPPSAESSDTETGDGDGDGDGGDGDGGDGDGDAGDGDGDAGDGDGDGGDGDGDGGDGDGDAGDGDGDAGDGDGDGDGDDDAVCGDGMIGGSEECDLGDDNGDESTCLSDCTLNVCGDGFESPEELCDDGNDDDDDDCTSLCAPPTCGDGLLYMGDDSTEECDLGIENSDTGECTSDCKVPVCGDGFVQPSNDENCEPPNTEICDSGCQAIGMEIQLLAENFDGLPNVVGASDAAIFQAALPIWGLFNTNGSRQVGSGTVTTGGIYSFGSNNASDRALGGIGSNATGSQGFGVCISNEGASDYQDITVSFVGEQWRNNGNATPQSLAFAFTTNPAIEANLQVGATVTDASVDDPQMGWFDVDALTFTGPVAAMGAQALDGNADANRIAISHTIPGLVVAPGGVVCMRWLDLNDNGNDHSLGIDDLVVTAMIFN